MNKLGCTIKINFIYSRPGKVPAAVARVAPGNPPPPPVRPPQPHSGAAPFSHRSAHPPRPPPVLHITTGGRCFAAAAARGIGLAEVRNGCGEPVSTADRAPGLFLVLVLIIH